MIVKRIVLPTGFNFTITLGISLFRHALGKIDTLLVSLTLLRNFFTPMQSGLFKCKRSFPRLNLASGIQSPRMKSRRVVTQSKMVSKPLMKEEATRIGCVLQTSNVIIYKRYDYYTFYYFSYYD